MIVFIYSVFRAAFISLHHLRLLCLWKIDSFTLFLALEKDCCCCSVTQSRPTLCKPMDYSMPDLPHHLLEFAQVNIQHRLCRPAISSSDVLFFFCPQSFPTSGTFWMIGMFTSDDQNTVVSVSVLPVNIQDWSPLRLTGLILLSKGLLGVFSSNTVRRHQVFGILLSLQYSSHNHTWPLDYTDLCWQSNVSAFQYTV